MFSLEIVHQETFSRSDLRSASLPKQDELGNEGEILLSYIISTCKLTERLIYSDKKDER